MNIKELDKGITRSDYMENSSELFHTYYSQFVTDATLRYVKDTFGIDRLRKAINEGDEHLNSLCRHTRGGAGPWKWDYSPINRSLAEKLNECTKGYHSSPSTHTCVGKAAARILLENEEV